MAFRDLIRKDIWDTIVEKGMYLHDRDLLDVSSAEVLANLDDINKPPMVHYSANGQELCLYFINNDIIFTEHFPAKYPETQVWGMDENTYDEDIEESVNWLSKNGYPVEGIKYDRHEPKSNEYKSVWKSPDFDWHGWYPTHIPDQSGRISMKGPEIQQIPKILVTGEAINELKLALEDAIDQLHYLDDTEIEECPFNELRYTTRKSIINLRTQLERLFPDSKLIEKYKEVTLD